jgi:ubiquinone/menaquinone biosynthesis C-methylase UbiE
MNAKMLFDEWPERYESWFTTPIGKLVRETEGELINELLDPQPGEFIFDAGCGTGVFTLDFLSRGARVVGLDISKPMLEVANQKARIYPFRSIQGDMLYLPFKNEVFDKTASITALEFIEDAQKAVDELFRVTRPGGWVVLGTLNSLSPWAARRKAKTEKHVLQEAYFRSPQDLLQLTPAKGLTKTVVHFLKNEDPIKAKTIEQAGQSQNLDTGAFVAVKWQKPSTSSPSTEALSPRR